MRSLILLMLCLITIRTHAQPVLPADVPLGLDAMRAVITMNGDGTQSVMYDWEYDMYPPQAFVGIHIIPVPSEPIIELLPNDALEALANRTLVHFREPDNPCPYTGDRGIPGYDYRDVTITEARYVHGDSIMGRIDEWLGRGFWVDTRKMPDIQTYVDMGMGFVAVTIPFYGNEEGAVSPIKLTYPSDAPILHTLYTTLYAQVWIFADGQYIPQNYNHPAPDYTTFHATGEESVNFYVFNYVQGRVTSASYNNFLSDITHQYDRFFVTEYATPTDAIEVGTDPLLTDLTMRFAYMTSLRGRVAVDDPVFVLAPDLPDMPREVNLADYADPRVFWECDN
jgi:hypothetical protein